MDAPNPHPCIETERQLFEIAELILCPVQMYKTNGDLVFINEAVMGSWNLHDRSKLVGVYNLKKDSLVNDELGLREHLPKHLYQPDLARLTAYWAFKRHLLHKERFMIFRLCFYFIDFGMKSR